MKAAIRFETIISDGFERGAPVRLPMRSDTTAATPQAKAAKPHAKRRAPIRAVVVAAALGVAACFAAAASFSGDPAVAAEAKATQNR
jgi:hypothetical protein